MEVEKAIKTAIDYESKVRDVYADAAKKLKAKSQNAYSKNSPMRNKDILIILRIVLPNGEILA